MVKKLKNIKIPLAELFYFGYLVPLFFAKGIGLYDGQTSFKVFLVFALFCYGAKMLMTSYRFWELLVIGGLLSIGAFTYYLSGEKGALLYIMMVTGMKNVSLGRIFKVLLVTWTVSFGGMVLLTASGIITSPYKIHEKFGLGHLIRWGLGHSHPNVLHISYLTFAMLAIYVLGKRINLKWLGLLMLGNLYVFLYSLSSTGFISVCVFLMLNIYWLYRKKIGLPEKILIYAVLPGCIILSLVAPFLLTGRAFEIVDKMLNTRLYLTKHFLTNTPPALLGTRTADITSPWYAMDNSYLYAYVAYGIILFSLIMLAYFVIIHRFVKTNKRMELSIILTTLAAGLIEPFLFNVSFKNVSLFFIGETIFGSKDIRKSIYFLPERFRNICITLPDIGSSFLFFVHDSVELVQKKRLRFGLIFTVVAFIGGLLCYLLIPYPDAYVAPRKHCEMKDWNTTFSLISYPDGYIIPSEHCEVDDRSTMFFLESSFYADEKIRVLEDVDPEMPLEYFTGNIVMMEKIRNMITGGLLLGLSAVFAFILLDRRKRKRSSNHLMKS